MRPIKFRAWDGVNMWPSVGFCDNDCGRLIQPERGMMGSVDNFLQDPPSNSKPTVVLTQFTGLHDKYGKEIWEGDIVKLHKQNALAEMTGEVKYGLKGNMAGQFVCYLWDGFRNLTEYEIIEVVGNIYENPELLNP